MNRLERIDDKELALMTVLTGWQAGLYTALPALIEKFDPVKQTCEAVVAIQAKVTDKDGREQWVTLPKLVDVPVHFPAGGGYTLTFPVVPGDEALIVFSSRCIDNWYVAGGVQSQADLRMHDLSDAIALVGLRSQVRLLSGGVKTSAAQLRSDDGSTYVELASGTVNVRAPTSATVTAPLVNVVATTKVEITSPLVHCSQALTVEGPITGNGGLAISGGTGSTFSGNLIHTNGNLTSNGKTLHTHTHSDPQGGTTGGPI